LSLRTKASRQGIDTGKGILLEINAAKQNALFITTFGKTDEQ